MKLTHRIRRADGWSDDVIAGIHVPDTDILVARRPLAVECGDLVAGGTIGEVRFKTSSRGAAAKIARGLERLDMTAPTRQRVRLADDILGLVCGMLAVFQWPRVEVRLQLTNEQSCPTFHGDNVVVRLVTTYVGPGTEFIERHAADTVHRAGTGSLVFLKGCRHPTHADRVLHRSPPMQPSARRFTVAIDWADWLTAAVPENSIAGSPRRPARWPDGP
jgi:hypothetical protein